MLSHLWWQPLMYRHMGCRATSSMRMVFCYLRREISCLRVSKKYLRWCRRSRRIEWYLSWPPSPPFFWLDNIFKFLSIQPCGSRSEIRCLFDASILDGKIRIRDKHPDPGSASLVEMTNFIAHYNLKEKITYNFSFYHQAKILRKTLIPTVLLLLFDFLSLYLQKVIQAETLFILFFLLASWRSVRK